MPSTDTQFKGNGLGTKNNSQPISVKFPPEIDQILRDKSIISNRSDYIRKAIEAALVQDGVISAKLFNNQQ